LSNFKGSVKVAGGVYIPQRTYERLKCIYSERITVVCAPTGSGKSTILREFVRRSRPDGYSCRFVTGCSSMDECFGSMCRILFGKPERMPIIDEDAATLYGRFREVRLERPLLVVLDCSVSAEMLLGNLHCLRLFQLCEGLHIVAVSDEYSHFQHRLITQLSLCEITEQELALTAEETRQYLSLCGADNADYEKIAARTGGNIFRISLCALMIKQGIHIRSYDTIRLIHAALISSVDRVTHLAMLCASAYFVINESICSKLAAVPVIAAYFGEDAFDVKRLYDCLDRVNAVLSVVSVDKRTGVCEVHQLAQTAINRSFVLLPQNVQHSICLVNAEVFAERDMYFVAFCNCVMARDYYKAAEMAEKGDYASIIPLFNAREVMFKFVLECPLDCRPILPWLIHVLVLMMFTPYKERVMFRFDEIIRYISTSTSYTEREKRTMLAYTYSMRTYQDFYVIDKMGMNIKRAYEYFNGERVYAPPFYLWALYVPSVFALVHRYSVPLSAQSEQYVRYNRMYLELSGQGCFFDQVYLAEMRYSVGDIADAWARARAILREAVQPEDIAPRLIAYTVATNCAILSGSYEEYKGYIADVAAIMRDASSGEVYQMGALCLAIIGCHDGSGADVWRITAVPDAMLLSNRFAAPFCMYVRCISMLADKEYSRLISRLDYFLDNIAETGSETLELKVRLCAAVAYYNMKDMHEALEQMRTVLGVLVRSEVIMPAVEMCIHAPQLFEYARQHISEHTDYLGEIMRIAKPMRRSVDDLRTRQLTEIGREFRHYDAVRRQLDRLDECAKDVRKRLGITAKALGYAVFAAHGYSNEEIAKQFGSTADSVKSSLKRTFAVLGVRSRAQLKYVQAVRECMVGERLC